MAKEGGGFHPSWAESAKSLNVDPLDPNQIVEKVNSWLDKHSWSWGRV